MNDIAELARIATYVVCAFPVMVGLAYYWVRS